MSTQTFFNTWTPRVLSLLRFGTGFVYLQNGTSKLLGIPHVAYFDNLPLWSLAGVAGLIELVGGLLLILGLFTRPAAFIVSGQMAVAYFMGHAATHPLAPSVNQGLPAVLFSFIFFYFVFSGPGPWSLDALIAKKRRT